jgi:deoxyhypusine synthase
MSSLAGTDLACRSFSVLQNNIPVFCPALTDGSLGDMLYFHSYKSEHPLVIDIVSDIRYLNDMSVRAKKAGMVILGGGVCKHQIANAMLFVRPAASDVESTSPNADRPPLRK